MAERKRCCDCAEAMRFGTGSTLFIVCYVTKEYRSLDDYCSLDGEAKR